MVALELPRRVLHWVQDEHPLRDVFVLMRREPVREDGVGRLGLVARELHDFDTRGLQLVFEVIELFLRLHRNNHVRNKELVKMEAYLFVGGGLLEVRVLHEFVVLLAVDVLVEVLGPDDDDLVREGG